MIDQFDRVKLKNLNPEFYPWFRAYSKIGPLRILEIDDEEIATINLTPIQHKVLLRNLPDYYLQANIPLNQIHLKFLKKIEIK